jgi:hypothetical protein
MTVNKNPPIAIKGRTAVRTTLISHPYIKPTTKPPKVMKIVITKVGTFFFKKKKKKIFNIFYSFQKAI